MSNQIDKETVDAITETNTKIVVNNTMKQAYTASAQLGLIQTVNLDLSNNTGDIVLGEIEQNQDAKLNFTSVKPNDVFNESSVEIIESTVKQFEKIGNEKLEPILAEAEKTDATKFNVSPYPILEMNTRYATADTTLTPTVYNKLRNVVTNNLTNSFTQNIVMSCLANITAKQVLDINIKNQGLVEISTIVQKQAVTLLMSCTQLTSTMNNVTNDIIKTLGLQVAVKTTVLPPASLVQTAQAMPNQDIIDPNDFIENNKQNIASLLSSISCCMSCLCILIIILLALSM